MVTRRLQVRNQKQSLLNLSATIPEKKNFLNKKLLKGTQVSIRESLTAKRVGILKKARKKHQFCNMWTAGGRILYKDGDNNKVKLYYD